MRCCHLADVVKKTRKGRDQKQHAGDVFVSMSVKDEFQVRQTTHKMEFTLGLALISILNWVLLILLFALTTRNYCLVMRNIDKKEYHMMRCDHRACSHLIAFEKQLIIACRCWLICGFMPDTFSASREMKWNGNN